MPEIASRLRLAAAACLACAPHAVSAQERLLCTVPVPPTREPALPASTIDDLCAGLAACWQPPKALAERAHLEVTVLLLPGRNGSILGLPRLTYAAGVVTREDRESLVQATIEAIRHCPAPMTPALAGRAEGHRTFLHIIYDKTPR